MCKSSVGILIYVQQLPYDQCINSNVEVTAGGLLVNGEIKRE